MRLRVGCLLFFLGALLAACGGGGTSGIVPGVPQQTGGAPAPAQTGDRQLAVVLKIPPASQQSHARRPFFVSTNTQSIVFAVVPNGSGTPTPAQEQSFRSQRRARARQPPRAVKPAVSTLRRRTARTFSTLRRSQCRVLMRARRRLQVLSPARSRLPAPEPRRHRWPLR